MEDWDIISKDNLNYMLLTGQDFETIQTMHKDLNNYQQYLHLSIAHPQNLQKLISLGQKEESFDIDNFDMLVGMLSGIIAQDFP